MLKWSDLIKEERFKIRKVNLFDKKLNESYFKILSIISTILALTLSFIEIPSAYKSNIAWLFLFLIIVTYLVLFIIANKTKKSKLKINNSTLEIKVGDIFSEPDLKVIGFNEYFDTIVDDKIISERTLNGMYINKLFKNNVEELDLLISTSESLERSFISKNEHRKRGKKDKYELGSIVKVEDYLLVALTKFNDNNNARITISEYVLCLLKMWEEIDMIYSGKSISLPLLGSNMTRIKEHCHITDQELLSIMIWTFEISRMKIAHPAKVSIIISKNNEENIDFYNIRRW